MPPREAPADARRQWLDAALEVLRREGVERVRVERLAARLGITKGSFYWHFDDRAALLDALPRHWSQQLTDTVFERIRARAPRARVAELLRSVVLEGLGRFDPAMRAWARVDLKVARAVAAVDRRRIEAVARLFGDAGYDAAESRARAQLLYGFLLGEHHTHGRVSRAQRARALDRIAAILTR